jgi:hypothetical protein
VIGSIVRFEERLNVKVISNPPDNFRAFVTMVPPNHKTSVGVYGNNLLDGVNHTSKLF